MVSAGRLLYPKPAPASAVSAPASSSAMNAAVPSSPRVVAHRIRLTPWPAIASHSRASSPGWFFRSTVNTLIWRSSVRDAERPALGRAYLATTRPGITRRGHQECSDHGGEPLHPIEHALVGGTGKQGELRWPRSGGTAGHAAAQKPEHLHGMLGPDDVRIADDQQRRGGQRLEACPGPRRPPGPVEL